MIDTTVVEFASVWVTVIVPAEPALLLTPTKKGRKVVDVPNGKKPRTFPIAIGVEPANVRTIPAGDVPYIHPLADVKPCTSAPAALEDNVTREPERFTTPAVIVRTPLTVVLPPNVNWGEEPDELLSVRFV